MNRMLIDCFKKSIYVSLVVGTILSLVNQSPAILSLSFNTEVFVRIFFNYLIPLCVATYSRYSLMKEVGVICSTVKGEQK